MEVQQVLSLFHSEMKDSLSIMEYAKHLLEGVIQHKKEIDILLDTKSKAWSLYRMPLVDRNIMRIGVFELRFSSEKVKHNIVLNEAVELAKIYGDKDSFKFINGVLDQITT